MRSIPPAALAITAAALLLPACTTTPYTGPVEVTRFVADQAEGLGRGTIALAFPDDSGDLATRAAFASAVSAELTRLGYTVVPEGSPAGQIATIRTARKPIAAAEQTRSGPVNVGIGGQTGSYGSSLGVGVGIDLGGGRESPSVVTYLSVRIARADGRVLWEGRAELTTGVKSPYSQTATSARTLAAGLFKDFPGLNGETVTISVKRLQEN
jgi:hypothetical protein